MIHMFASSIWQAFGSIEMAKRQREEMSSKFRDQEQSMYNHIRGMYDESESRTIIENIHKSPRNQPSEIFDRDGKSQSFSPAQFFQIYDAISSGRTYLEEGWTQQALRQQYRVDRMFVYVRAQGNDELKSEAIRLYNKSQSLPDGSEKSSIVDILHDGPIDGKSLSKKMVRSDISALDIARGYEILHQHKLEENSKREVARGFLLGTFVVLTVATISIIGLVALGVENSVLGEGFGPKFLLLAAMFGVMGASMSSLVKGGKEYDLPLLDELGTWLSVVRATVGASSAIIVTVFLLAGLLGIESNTPGVLLGFAFVAGFSERLVQRMVRDIEKEATTTSTNSEV